MKDILVFDACALPEYLVKEDGQDFIRFYTSCIEREENP
jgi:hypothetical protein